MKPRVSFVVPVRNDAVRLKTCLRSIALNDHGSDQIEVIVVDNGSTDASAAVARRCGADVLSIEHARVAELRNQGARRASADVLAFIDADNEIAAGWVYAALECLRLPKTAVVGALYQPPVDGTWVQRTYGHLRGIPDGQHDADWLGSGNLAVSRAAFEAVGGFDTTLETCEDVDFCHRIRARGLRVISDARLKSIHHGDPKTLGEVFSSERWRGRDNLRVSFRRPVAWSALPSAVLPIVQGIALGIGGAGLVAAFVAPRIGLLLIAASLVSFAAGTWARVARAAWRARPRRAVSMLAVFIVASVLDVARALALVSRAPHRGVRPRPAPAAS
jgi:GT2 family glycosyltransferase